MGIDHEVVWPRRTIHSFILTYTDTQMHTQTYIYTLTNICMYTHIHTHMCACICIYAHTYICTYVHNTFSLTCISLSARDAHSYKSRYRTILQHYNMQLLTFSNSVTLPTNCEFSDLSFCKKQHTTSLPHCKTLYVNIVGWIYSHPYHIIGNIHY